MSEENYFRESFCKFMDRWDLIESEEYIPMRYESDEFLVALPSSVPDAVCIFATDIRGLKVPEEKFPEIIRYCNEINRNYNMAKFYLEREKRSLTASLGMILAKDERCELNVGALAEVLTHYIDKFYPEFRRILDE